MPLPMSAHDVQNATGAVDSRHLLIVGAGPGLGASVARRFAREGYRLVPEEGLEPPTRGLRHPRQIWLRYMGCCANRREAEER